MAIDLFPLLVTTLTIIWALVSGFTIYKVNQVDTDIKEIRKELAEIKENRAARNLEVNKMITDLERGTMKDLNSIYQRIIQLSKV